MRRVDFGWDTTTNTSAVSRRPNLDSNTYEFLASTDCGPITCASQPLNFFTPEHQVQVFQVCVDPATNIETFGVIGLVGQCQQSSTNSFFLVGIGSRIESDRNITLGPNPDVSTLGFPAEFDFNNSQKAIATNARRYRAISIVRFSWGTFDMPAFFNAKCAAGDCFGYYQYFQLVQQSILLVKHHYPISKAARFCSQDTEWTLVAAAVSPATGNRELFTFSRLAPSEYPWVENKKSKPVCSPEIEKLAVRQLTNHYYSGYPLLATRMSGYLFFLQFAAVCDTLFVFDNLERTAKFNGNTVDHFYALQVPLTAGIVSFLACAHDGDAGVWPRHSRTAVDP